MLSRRYVIFSATLLAACGHTPEFQRPASPVPPQWAMAGNGTAPSDAAKIHWRAFFSDPRLQKLIEAALENNRDLRIAAARVAESRAQYGVTRADRFPTISAVGSSAITQTPGDLSGTGAEVNSERYDVSLTSVSFEVDFWGRIARLTEAAKASYLATESAQRAVQLSLISDVAAGYYTLIQLDELATLTQSSVESREQSLDLIARGRDLGGAYDFEYQQAVGNLESTRAALDTIEHQRTVTINRLHYLIGAFPEGLPQGRKLDEQGLDTNLAPGLPSEVLLLRPDVIAAEMRLKAANANIAAARAAFWPKVLLTAGLGTASQGLAGLFSGTAWSFQPSISMPLFDGGRVSSGIELAKARKVIAVTDYEKTIQIAFREVADLLSARASMARQMRSAIANEKSHERRLHIAKARYEGGLVSLLEVLEAERELVSAQQGTTQVRRVQLETAAQLYKALGGGEKSNV
jgi:multidrug efflux system outer membrane protein